MHANATLPADDPLVRCVTKLAEPAQLKHWLLAILISTSLVALSVVASTTPDEFTPAAVKFEGWLTGGYGTMAAFLAVGIGVVIAAFTKSIFPAATGIGIAVIISITLAVINASFTAVI